MKFDLHVHTEHSSDGSNKVEDIIRILKERGFGGAAILDHNSVDGAREALNLHPEGFIVIPSVEVSSAGGHILALNVTDPIKRDMGVLDTIEAIHKVGGIAVAAHPYRYWSGLGEKNILGRPFDAIEAHNARSEAGSNRKAMVLAQNLGAAITGGSDSHDNQSLGAGYTVVPDDCRTKEEVIKAILQHRTEVGGTHRSGGDTMGYVAKSVSEWMGRGMKKM
jgi:predicted metal-dependent phosphoesterase TrpH